MPYANNSELPKAVRGALPAAAQTVFRMVFNSQSKTGESDTAAFQSAWGALKSQGWEKTAAGMWHKVAKANYTPPQEVQNAARRGLELRRKHGRGGLDTRQAGAQGIGSGVARARDLANGKSLPLSTIKRMKSFFARHANNRNNVMPDGTPSAGAIAWLLWGGNAGRNWVNSVLNNLEKAMLEDIDDFTIEGEISKVDAEKRLVFGWASVIFDKSGEQVVDHQGDVIREEELEKAAYDYVHDVRLAGEMHKTVDGVGSLVESMVFTKEKQEALGIPEGVLPTGWWIGFRLSDEAFGKVKSGEYKMFSIGGSGKRKIIGKAQELDESLLSDDDFGGGCENCGYGDEDSFSKGDTCPYCGHESS